MLSVQKNAENRSLKTNRLFPTPNKPDPMPQNLAFLFTKITPDRVAVFDHVIWARWFLVQEGDIHVQQVVVSTSLRSKNKPCFFPVVALLSRFFIRAVLYFLSVMGFA